MLVRQIRQLYKLMSENTKKRGQRAARTLVLFFLLYFCCYFNSHATQSVDLKRS